MGWAADLLQSIICVGSAGGTSDATPGRSGGGRQARRLGPDSVRQFQRTSMVYSHLGSARQARRWWCPAAKPTWTGGCTTPVSRCSALWNLLQAIGRHRVTHFLIALSASKTGSRLKFDQKTAVLNAPLERPENLSLQRCRDAIGHDSHEKKS